MKRIVVPILITVFVYCPLIAQFKKEIDMGKRWYKEIYEESLNEKVVDMSSFTAGIYSVKIRSNNYFQVNKVLKF